MKTKRVKNVKKTHRNFRRLARTGANFIGNLVSKARRGSVHIPHIHISVRRGKFYTREEIHNIWSDELFCNTTCKAKVCVKARAAR